MIPATTTSHSSLPVKGRDAARPASDRTPWVSPRPADEATAAGASPPALGWAGVGAGSGVGCLSFFGPFGGFGVGSGVWSGFGSRVGSGVGFGVGPGGLLPQRAECRPWRAWTSRSCPPAQGAALCGWLLPGPWSTVLPGAPWSMAMPPAVCPFPYSLVSSDSACACVSWAVLFEGFTPSVGAALGAATVVVAVVVVCAGAAASSFFI